MAAKTLKTQAPQAGGRGADALLAKLEKAQQRERRRREALPLRDAEAFESSCLRSEQLEAEMLRLRAVGREGLAVKFRELVYALRHHVPADPWIESLLRDLKPGREAQEDAAAQAA